MDVLKKLIQLLSPQEQKRAILVLIMILMMALLDVLGVASIMPFIAVLSNPELVETNNFLQGTYKFLGNFGITTTDDFIFALGVAVFTLLVASLSFKALTTYAQMRFTLMREYSIGKRLIEGYLHQPYSWFLSQNSADIGKNILSEVSTVVNIGMMPMMLLISQSAVVITLIVLLIFIDPILSISVGIVLSVAYLGIYKLTTSFLKRIGQEQFSANLARFSSVSEAFGAAKEVKVAGLESAYINRFRIPAEIYAKHQSSAQIVSQLPRYLLEAVSFGGMILLVLILMAKSESFADALPIITLYAFAGYRLIPALQQVYSSATQLRFVLPALDSLHKDNINLKLVGQNENKIVSILLNKVIRLNDITYSYPNSKKPALANINLTIPVNSKIGLVGATGSGKTTTIDIILGLLEPQKGTLEVDGQIINQSNIRSWQKSIGYVPQQIYLADDTVAANIAFGVDKEEIDQQAIERAAKIANLHDFVTNELDDGYQTTVGERGVRLSGGQRQRIGIARALYHKPKVLILDEATSALDNLTEKAVMEAMNNLEGKMTIILIAHRLSTVKKCDVIYLLERGQIKASGSYDELSQSNEQFRSMAKID